MPLAVAVDMLENIATTPSQVSRPRRSTVARVVAAVGPLLMLAALLVVVWPEAPSDCHGSPVCGLDGLAELGKLMFAGLLGFIGLMWTCAAAAASTVRQPPSSSRQ